MRLPEWLTAPEPLPGGLRALTLEDCVAPGDSRVYRDLTSLDSLLVSSCWTPDGTPHHHPRPPGQEPHHQLKRPHPPAGK
ncbi:hypothetical protein ACRAWF_13320 [Streptomyces sp. L7]